MTAKLTKSVVENARPDSKLWDSHIPGFGLFAGKSSKTFYFQRTLRGGKVVRHRLGRYPVVSVDEARTAAIALQLDYETGVAKTIKPTSVTVREALESYLARPKLRSKENKRNVHDMFHRDLADWLDRDLNEITARECVERHLVISMDRPVLANHCLKSLRTVWNHASRTLNLPECPTRAIEWNEERPDGRIIDDLSAWRLEVDALPNVVHAAYYRFLLFTGLRRTECASLRLSDIHDDYLEIPGERTKNQKTHRLPLFPIHHQILDFPRWGDFVFPANAASGHLMVPKRLTWSIHAHRRTFATVGVEAGVLEETVGRFLNHSSRTITGSRYALPSIDALRPAMETICTEIKKRTGSAGCNTSNNHRKSLTKENDMRLLTVKETAELLRLKRNTLDQWRMKKDGPPYVKVGRLVMYPEQKLESWLEVRIQ